MLIPPDDCPSNIRQMMKDCWRTEPRDRLSFFEIVQRLKKVETTGIQTGILPRPPEGPITIRTPNLVDSDGYLLPSPVTLREYLQPLPIIS